MNPSQLHVVSVFSNNRRWRSRERLLRKFITHMQASGVTLTLIEHVMGERDFVLDQHDPDLAGVRLFQIRGDSRQENWLKEGLIRYGVSRLPPDAKYLAVIDADVFFQRHDWAIA
ncbi:hypothetical protein CFR80_17890, partial [Komagataeibacter oboediens]